MKKMVLVFASCAVTPQLSKATENNEFEIITTTASRLAETAGERPVSLSLLTEAQLDDVGVTHIEKALRLVAGANIQHGNGQEYLPALRSQVLSGAGACGGILMAEDGIALRAAGFCNINELFESHFEAAERIEVLKGPNSVLYGSNAVHGVVNVITSNRIQKTPRVALDIGSYGYSRTRIQAGDKALGLGAALTLTKDSGYRDDESVEQQKLNVKHQYEGEKIGVVSGITYTHLDQQTAGYITGVDSYKNKQLAKQNENPEAFRKAESFRAWTEITGHVDDSNTVLIKPYVRWQEMEFVKHFLPGKPFEENGQTGVGLQTLIHTELSDSIQLDWGMDAEYTQGEMLQYQPTPTEGSAFLRSTIPTGKHYDYEVDARQLAPFANLSWQQGNWFVELGARFESMKYDYRNFLPTGRTKENGSVCAMGGCRYSRPASGKDSFAYFSPKFGLSYAFTERHIAYANVSKGYRAPQAAELYQLQRAQVKASLEEEKADNIELGLKGSADSLGYQVAIYDMEKENLIFRDSDFFYINDGRSRHRGVELELSYSFSAHWQLDLAATRAKHTYEQDNILGGININGNDLDSAPRNVINAQLHWQALDNLSWSLAWHHVGEYFTDPENLHRYSGHDLLSLRGKWQVNPHLALTVRVKNLTDEHYAERADYTSFSGERYFPGRPRNILVSLDYRW
ncbi:TonB-dependent receptor [Pseudoalteromonas sp. OF7H-1]|uniref:TonB-dependent receptor n=1 Tax=Pseudoalteromonas sp. OF7H-1 TaxID=2917755 RepID=UPI001EF425F4|nr:TonB-dependent receptor [Pseudoalteromonas sp. OF7H-1]MCG7540492.1 TonB-dependent receptor [Pseudoalteromonas sp. OF7H-1]